MPGEVASGHITARTFMTAAKEVYRMMEMDSFPRFKTSKFFTAIAYESEPEQMSVRFKAARSNAHSCS